MQHDDTIWSVISQGFCSFKMKLRDDVGHAGAKPEALCRNPYNVTGVCSRANCPLANSQYATVVEYNNELYLYMKTVERAHTPQRLWEKILLPKNFKEALAVINDNMQWWDRKLIMKCKHRLLRLKQVLIRKRRLAVRGMPKLVGVKKKEEMQLNKKEKKAEKAARIVTNIKKTLLERMAADGEVDGVTDKDIIEMADRLDALEGKDGIEEAEDASEGDEYEQYEPDTDDDSETESDEEEEEAETQQTARKRKRVEIEQETESTPLESRFQKSVLDW